MQQTSRQVSSNQQGIHKNLAALVDKHHSTHYQRPIPDHSRNAFDQLLKRHRNEALIFDSGCGTGRSSLLLAQQFPNALVVGIDKSSVRLQKIHHEAEHLLTGQHNLLLLRADMEDIVLLAEQANLSLLQHKLFYPNPWPKSKHLSRRWHGSPVFHNLLNLGGELELRSNWKLYLEEFALALQRSGHSCNIQQLDFNPRQAQLAESNSCYVSDFEEKYDKSGQPLWQLICQL